MNIGITSAMLLFGILFFTGCASTKLIGTDSGNVYIGARGDYSVPYPVDTAISGHVSGDDIDGVTFTDEMNTRISFYSSEIKANSQGAITLQNQGSRAALEKYIALAYHTTVPPHYHADVCGGAVSFTFLKVKDGERPCGVAAFLSPTHLYLVESEPPPAALFLGEWDKKPKQELDEMLEARALKLLQTIQLYNTVKFDSE